MGMEGYIFYMQFSYEDLLRMTACRLSFQKMQSFWKKDIEILEDLDQIDT